MPLSDLEHTKEINVVEAMTNEEKIAPELLTTMQTAHRQFIAAENTWQGLIRIVTEQYGLVQGETVDITTGVISRIQDKVDPAAS